MEVIESLTTEQLVDRIHSTARLRRLTEVGGNHNYLIVEVGPCRYIQFLSSCGSAVIYAEVSSGNFCRPACTCPPTTGERVAIAGARLEALDEKEISELLPLRAIPHDEG